MAKAILKFEFELEDSRYCEGCLLLDGEAGNWCNWNNEELDLDNSPDNGGTYACKRLEQCIEEHGGEGMKKEMPLDKAMAELKNRGGYCEGCGVATPKLSEVSDWSFSWRSTNEGPALKSVCGKCTAITEEHGGSAEVTLEDVIIEAQNQKEHGGGE